MLLDDEPSKQAPFFPPQQAWPGNAPYSAPPAYDEVLNQRSPTDSATSSSSGSRDVKTPYPPREEYRPAPPVRMDRREKGDRAPPNASYPSYAPQPTTYQSSSSQPVASGSGSSASSGALNLLNTVFNGVASHLEDKHARKQYRRQAKFQRKAQRWGGLVGGLSGAVGGPQGGQGGNGYPGGYGRGMEYGAGMPPPQTAGQWIPPPPPPNFGGSYGAQRPMDPRVPMPYDYPQSQQVYRGKGAPPM